MNKKAILLIVLLTVALFLQSTTLANLVKIPEYKIEGNNFNDIYDGHLRVYVIEPVSRWDDYKGEPYHFAFLDLAIDEELSIQFEDTYTTQAIWSGQESGYGNINENNIMVIAAVFNPESKISYAYPPTGHPFDAHYVDAAAAAKPGETGYNTVNDDFTHTIFIEEATATWCKFCPGTAEALKTVYDKQMYPFYFVAMVSDKSTDAKARLDDDYNIYAYPACFFDGGYKVVIGETSANTVENRVKLCGKRDVHELDLNVSVEWVSNGVIDISVSITNNEGSTGNNAPDKPVINGPSSGKKKQEYEFTFVSNDPENQTIEYWINWGDETNTGWKGPYNSGEEITLSHTWSNRNTFTIQAKARDTDEAESDWSTYGFSTPRIKMRTYGLLIDYLKDLDIFQKFFIL